MRHRLLACALMLATAASATGLAQDAALPTTTCAKGPSDADRAGLWDFYINAGGVPDFGLLWWRSEGATLTPGRASVTETCG